MAKMFYSLEEAAAKLGKTPDEVRALAASGQLPEFRDRDRLMFKVEHVDLLSGGGDDDHIPLADSGEMEPISLASSGSAMNLESPKEQTGISIFDADQTEEADPSAVTRITPAAGAGGIKVEDPGRSGSGSGLLDMTRDVDDTSLGANLLDDVYGSETVAAQTAEEPAQSEGGALFESPGAASEADADASTAGAQMVMMAPEAYDGAGSGLAGGLAVGAVLSLLVAAFAVVLGLAGTGSDLINMLGENIWAFVGGLAGVTALSAGLGWFLGRKS